MDAEKLSGDILSEEILFCQRNLHDHRERSATSGGLRDYSLFLSVTRRKVEIREDRIFDSKLNVTGNF